MPGLQDPFSGNPQRAWQRRANPVAPAIADGINKSRLAHPEPRRSRDKEHVRFVGAKPCLICGRRPADAHHLRFAQTHRNLSAKNCLIPADPQQVENAFQSKLAKLTTATENDGPLPSIPSSSTADPAAKSVRDGIDKSRLAHPVARRLRDKLHVKFVAKQPCVICGRSPSDPHHLRFVQAPALGCKISDEFTVPLCRGHHRELHRSGSEAQWWMKAAIDPIAIARVLWLETHPLPSPSARQPRDAPGRKTQAEGKP
jgi:hypothetical protein